MNKTLLSKLSSAKIRSIASNIDFTGMVTVKGGQRLVEWFLWVIRIGVGSMSLSWVRVAKAYGSTLYRLWKGQGVPGVVKYLKASSVLLQQSVGGHKLCDPGQLGPRVSRTRSGIPRIIPQIHRHRIRNGDVKLIRVWLTLFSLYRVLEFPGKLKLDTITDCGKDISGLFGEILAFMPVFLREIQKFSAQTVTARMSAVRMNPLSADINQLAEVLASYLLPAEPFHIRKSSPLSAEISKVRGLDTKVETYASTSLTGLVESAYAIRYSAIWGSFQQYAKWTNNWWIVERILELSDLAVGNEGTIGKLGTKEEPAGKVRVFAMVDPWTQWLMHPLHKWLFELLSRVPQDGTFDQMRPVNILYERDSIKRFWSYDLSAATDRLPVSIQSAILTAMFGSHIGENWKTILVGRQYKTPKGADVKFVKYAVGQPMGALSSWAMLALTHHFIVQWSAFRVHQRDNPGKFFKWFADYAVLGDDIVIANGRVAREYLIVMDLLGVGIGLAKSLVANNRTLEFAKRFLTPWGDASPISFKELVVAKGSLTVFHEFCKKFSVSHSVALSVMGYGYKVKGRMDALFDSMTGRLSTTLLVLEMSKYTFVDWVRLVAVGKKRDSGEYPLSRFWLAVSKALLARYNQVLSDRLRSLGKALTVMAKLSSLDLKSDSNFEDVEYELREGSFSKAQAQVGSRKGEKRLSVRNPAFEPKEIVWPFKAGYLRKLLAKPVILGSAIWVDVAQKVQWLKDLADARNMDPEQLYAELVSLDDRLSKIQDLSVIELRKNDSVERDQVINNVRVWYSVRNQMRKPEPLSLVSEPVVVRRKGEIVGNEDNGFRRVLWGFRIVVALSVLLLVYTLLQIFGVIPIDSVGEVSQSPPRMVTLTEALGLEVQEPVPGLWDPDPSVRQLAKALMDKPGSTRENGYDLGFAMGVVVGHLIKGALVIGAVYGSWVLLCYGVDKILFAIYYFGSTHPSVAGQAASTSVGQGIERLSVPQAPSISTGPFTPNTLEQVRSDLAYQAWMDNLDLSPIAALWENVG